MVAGGTLVLIAVPALAYVVRGGVPIWSLGFGAVMIATGAVALAVDR